MKNLRSTIENLAHQFAHDMLAAMHGSSLGDLAAHAGEVRASVGRVSKAALAAVKPARRSGRRKRSSAAEVQALKDAALAAAKALKGGFSKGQVMKKSGSKIDLGRPLSLLVEEGKLIRKGVRRLARYWVK